MEPSITYGSKLKVALVDLLGDCSMDVLGNINMNGNQIQQVSLVEEDFPSVPIPGRLVFKNKILYICTELSGGVPFWVPLTKSLSMKRFVVTAPALEWVLEHGLNASNVFVQVYDENGHWVIPDSINSNVFNTVTIAFNTPMVGSALVMRGEFEGNQFPLITYEQSFTDTTTWVITHNLGYNPTIQLYINNTLVQPQSLVFDSLNQATATFSSAQSGVARCI